MRSPFSGCPTPHRAGVPTTRVCPWPLLAGWLPQPLDLSQCITADTFSGYNVVVPIWSSTLCQTTVACEIDPCHVFGFLDHLHSDNFFFFKRYLMVAWKFKYLVEFQFSLPFIGILCLSYWNHLLKNRLKDFRLYSFSFCCSTHLREAIWSLNLAALRKDYSLLDALGLMIKMKEIIKVWDFISNWKLTSDRAIISWIHRTWDPWVWDKWLYYSWQ